MEFDFNIAGALGQSAASPVVACIDEAKLRGNRGRSLCEMLGTLGESSRRAQRLRKAVTFGTPHLAGQKIYIMVHGKRALGFLKTGKKRLFVIPPNLGLKMSRKTDVQGSSLVDIEPLCVLDFYVHESCQRNGCGRKIFDAVLAAEGVSPANIAYDRPSDKLLNFLRKHYFLSHYQAQNNNFVVFDEYFHDLSNKKSHAGVPGVGGQKDPVSLRRASPTVPAPPSHPPLVAAQSLHSARLSSSQARHCLSTSQPKPPTPRWEAQPEASGLHSVKVSAPWGTSFDLPPPPQRGRSFLTQPSDPQGGSVGYKTLASSRSFTGSMTNLDLSFGEHLFDRAAGKSSGMGSCLRSSSIPCGSFLRQDGRTSVRFGSPFSRAGRNLLASGVR